MTNVEFFIIDENVEGVVQNNDATNQLFNRNNNIEIKKNETTTDNNL